MLCAYGDDGADEKRERVIAIGLIAGYEESWQQVECDWSVRCGGIPFHATDCESNRGDYRSFSHEQTKDLYRDLTGILAASELTGIGIAIDLTAQKKILPGGLPLSYFRAFLDSLTKLVNLAEKIGEVAHVTFDMSAGNQHNASLLYSWARNGDDRLNRWLHSEISFAPWRESPRLQAADLLAYEAWKALDHSVGPIKRFRRSWELLRATGRFETLSYSVDWFLDLKAHIDSGELQKKVGFCESDYLAWLREGGLNHSISNLIHFLEWIGTEGKNAK